jgi:hypothetical protein
MNFSASSGPHGKTGLNRAHTLPVLAREAGMPFQLPLGKDADIDPITEWLSLMEVVEMLCPVWPVRDTPMAGDQWRL